MAKEKKKYKQIEPEPQYVSEPVISYNKLPCQFTQEELLEQIETAREQYKNGEFITWEELKKDWATW